MYSGAWSQSVMIRLIIFMIAKTWGGGGGGGGDGGGDACTTNPYIYMCKLFSKRMFYWPAIISIETLFRLVSISSSFKNTSLHYASCSLICVDIAN